MSFQVALASNGFHMEPAVYAYKNAIKKLIPGTNQSRQLLYVGAHITILRSIHLRRAHAPRQGRAGHESEIYDNANDLPNYIKPSEMGLKMAVSPNQPTSCYNCRFWVLF